MKKTENKGKTPQQEQKERENIYRSLKQNTSRKKWELDEIISKPSQP